MVGLPMSGTSKAATRSADPRWRSRGRWCHPGTFGPDQDFASRRDRIPLVEQYIVVGFGGQLRSRSERSLTSAPGLSATFGGITPRVQIQDRVDSPGTGARSSGRIPSGPTTPTSTSIQAGWSTPFCIGNRSVLVDQDIRVPTGKYRAGRGRPSGQVWPAGSTRRRAGRHLRSSSFGRGLAKGRLAWGDRYDTHRRVRGRDPPAGIWTIEPSGAWTTPARAVNRGRT